MIVYKQGSTTKINLTTQMYIACGGQAQVFGNSSTIYKIYHNKSEAIPLSKIQELECLNKPNILKPVDPLMNKKGDILGFTMKRLKNTLPLCKLFTNEIWRRLSITTDTIIDLVNNIREVTEFIHKNNCLIIDGNEFNYLTDEGNLSVPYFIDVDSYQTPSFPASFIMPSIKDYHSKKFSELTDWFSFGIIACQLFIGVHPFRGGHPDYKKTDLEGRMKGSVSIFNSKVKVPPPTRDFDLIPKLYKEWFINLFENNERIAPPIDAGAVTIKPISIKIIISNTDFDIKLIKEFGESITYYNTIFGIETVKTTDHVHIGATKLAVGNGVEIIYTPVTAEPLLAKIEGNQLHIKGIKKTVSVPKIECSDMMIINNVLFIRNKDKLMEVQFYENNENIKLMIGNVWNIMPNSSTMFRGVIYQNILGKAYLTIPKKNNCQHYHIPELNDYKIINAKYENGICEIVGFNSNQYDKMIFTLDKSKYFSRKIENIQNTELNFIVLDNNIVISITDDFMEVYKKGSSSIKKIANSYTNSNTVLCKDGINVRFFTNNKLYSIKMK